jgi:hypothetical protein
MDKEPSALLRCAYQFGVHSAANSSKSGEPILHQEHPYIKSCGFLTDYFKNLNSVGLPWLGPNLLYKEIISTTFS